MRGIYFIASGERYIKEAVIAIKQIRKIMPSVPIVLCSDQRPIIEVDYFIKLDNPTFSFADKVNNYFQTPFEYSYIDNSKIQNYQYINSDFQQIESEDFYVFSTIHFALQERKYNSDCLCH